MGSYKAIALTFALLIGSSAYVEAQPAPAPAQSPDARQSRPVERDDDTDWGWLGLLGLAGLLGLMKRDRDPVRDRTTPR